MNTAYIGVGTNIEHKKHARAAIYELASLDVNRVVSPIYECAAVGFSSQQNFYNFVIRIDTSLGLEDLAKILRQVEIKWGRAENAQKYQDRTLDLDIVLFGDVISEQPELPRSDVFKYPFVIKPLFDLKPDLIIPGDGRTIADLYQMHKAACDALTPVSFTL